MSTENLKQVTTEQDTTAELGSEKGNSLKSKNMMYAQNLDHLPCGSTDKLKDILDKKVKPRKYALIVHDKEVDKNGKPKAPDVHVMMTFKNARHVTAIAKQLGDKPQYVEVWRGEANNGYAYLIHATEKARKEGKHQYDPSEVNANFDYPALMERIIADIELARAEHGIDTKMFLNMLYKGQITKLELEDRLTGSQYAQLHRHIEEVWAKRLKDQAAEWRKKMIAEGKPVKTIWIYGRAGTGKTSLAKEYAQKSNQEYFFSGSSRDVFQDYAGQHTIILDEFRPNVIPYHDLLRMTDPFSVDTQIMAPARYNDKALACDLFIITTPYDPYEFYRAMFKKRFYNPASPYENTENTDSFDQLLRRLSLVVFMDEQTINAMQYDGQNGFQPTPGCSRPNPYSRVNRPAPAVSAVDIYNSMFS